MNKLKKITIILIPILMLFITSCDDLNNLALNVPVEVPFSVSGSETNLNESVEFSLSQAEAWRENQDDINSAKFLTASYWTLEGTSSNLEGDLTFSLYNNVGSLLFSYDFGRIVASDYVTNALQMQLTDSQIAAFDNYLNNLSNNDASFRAEVTVSNISGNTNTSGNFVLNGKVEIVLETDVNVNWRLFYGSIITLNKTVTNEYKKLS